MSLKPCRECGAQVSSKARICPACGINKPTKNKPSFLVVVIAVSFIMVVIAAGAGKQDQTTDAAKAVSEKTDAAYENAEASFFECAEYRAKKENLPIYNSQTIGQSIVTLFLECQDVYLPAYNACIKTGASGDDCKKKLGETAFSAIHAAE